VFRVSLAIALSATQILLACAQARPSTQFPIGEYVRLTPSPSFPSGGRETGNLRLVESSPARATFQLEVTMSPVSTDDGALTRNGGIEAGQMLLNDRSAIYRSANVEDNELGTCVLNFRRSGPNIVVAQSGKCWWFGEGVNATGTYRPAREGEIHVVRQRAF